MNLIVLAFILQRFLPFAFLCRVGRTERGNNVQMLSHSNTKTERESEGERERPTLASSQTDTNRQLQSEDCCLFGEGKKWGAEKKREKFI